MKKSRLFFILSAIPLLLYIEISKHEYDETSAKLAATSAFSVLIAKKCNFDINEIDIKIKTIKLYDGNINGRYIRYYDVTSNVSVGSINGTMAGSVYGTVSILGYNLNGTDITGMGFNCPSIHFGSLG